MAETNNLKTEQTKQKSSKTFYIALLAVWTALLLAASVIPAYPILGTGASITFSSILLSSLTAPLLGPLYGALSGLIFGILVVYVNPLSSIGLLTFLSPMLSALMGGLFLFNKWKAATVILVCQLAIWLANPFAWYELMPIILWQYIPIFIFLLVPPIRKWIINTISSANKAHLPIALWCLAWISRIGGDVATGNNIFVWVLGFVGPNNYPFWAPLTAYYAVADSLNCLIGALIGTAVLVAIKKSGLKIAVFERLQEKIALKN